MEGKGVALLQGAAGNGSSEGSSFATAKQCEGTGRRTGNESGGSGRDESTDSVDFDI